jgi:Domain of unknown function (DUF4291)
MTAKGTPTGDVPYRQIRAAYDDDTITVYQAFAEHIGAPAARFGTFEKAPFSLDRMTWIKPSFLWMMYRSGWATKPGQEHVLAIRITRAGFERALSRAVLSHFEPETYPDHAAWESLKNESPVRLQWDPERDLALQQLPWRSLQLGLSGPSVREYVSEWVVGIEDICELVREVHEAVEARQLDAARASLPAERPYPLSAGLAAHIGAGPPRL